MKPGEVYKTRNGNLYLVLPGNREVYIGNEDLGRSDPEAVRPLAVPMVYPVNVVTSLQAMPWKEGT